MISVLILADELKYSCGITSFLYYSLKSFNDDNYKFQIICSGGDSIERFREMGIGVIKRKSFSWKQRNYLNFIYSTLFLFFFMIRNHINIIHSQTHYAANIAKFAKFLSKVRTIQTHHNLFFNEGKLKLLSSDYHVVVNNQIRNYLIKQYPLLDPLRIKVIRCGIEPKIVFMPKPNTQIKIIAAGRFIEEKGFDTYLDAIKMLPDNIFLKAQFYLAGEGERLSHLIERIKKDKIRVEYIGNLKPLINTLEKTDIFIFPSHWESEGFPISILEAGMTKNLIITSDFLALHGHFKDFVDGLIFPQRDSIVLTKKIIYSVENFNALQKMTNNFYNFLINNFSIDIAVHKLKKLYCTIS